MWYIDLTAQGAGREARDWIFWKKPEQPPPSPEALLTRMAETAASAMKKGGE